MAEHLEQSTRSFRARYLVRMDGEWSLGSRGDACVFLEEGGGCAVYPVRPRQCRTWPFWPQNLRKAVWEREVVDLCPGIGRGRLYTEAEIRAVARAAERRAPVPDLPLCGGEDAD
jgi:Fe-S-cluster containining protein